MFTSRTSIHGRNMAISATGGFITARDSTGGGSTAFDMAAQMWGKAMVETVSSAGASISNVGLTIVSTDSTSGASFTVTVPVIGVSKEIHFETSATAHTFNTTGTNILFGTSASVASTLGSTTLSISSSAAGISGTIVLRGLSATKWQIVSHAQTMTVSS